MDDLARSLDASPTLHELSTGSRRPVLLRGAAVLSCDPDVGDFTRGDVLLRGTRIDAVGPDLLAQAGADTLVIDASGTIALPGFVDSHVHAWEGVLRGVDAQADFGAYLGLTAFGWGPRAQPEDVYAGTLVTALGALDAGITTVVDNAHNALTTDHIRAGVAAARSAGVRTVHAVGSPFGSDLPHLPRVVPQLADELDGDLVSLRLFEVNPTRTVWEFARDHGLWVSTELGPHTPHVDDVVADLHRLGLLTPQHTFNHAYDLDPRTWDLIAASGAAVNLAPRSDAQFGLGTSHTPLDQALSRGITVGLSGDNEVSYGLSMFTEMSNLASRYRAQGFSRRITDHDAPAPTLTPAQLLAFATLGGARNAGLSHQIGSLTPGKQADVILVRADAATTFAVTDAATAVTAFAHSGNVDTVFVAGRLRKHHGRLLDIDLTSAADTVAASRERLAQPATIPV